MASLSMGDTHWGALESRGLERYLCEDKEMEFLLHQCTLECAGRNRISSLCNSYLLDRQVYAPDKS